MTTRRQQATGFMIELPFPSRIPIFPNFEASQERDRLVLAIGNHRKNINIVIQGTKKPDCIVRLLPSKFCPGLPLPEQVGHGLGGGIAGMVQAR